MMIGTLNLGNGGRLGNQLFHYASLIGLADKYGHTLQLPVWEYAAYFDHPYPYSECLGYEYQEQTFHYEPNAWEFLKDADRVYDIKGYLQSEKFWLHCKDKIMKALTFKEDFKERVRRDYDFSKITIAISIRRGDYVANANYSQLLINYFYLALTQWPDWKDSNIIIFSDDIPYCRVHFGCLPNVKFSENNTAIEDICLMSQCQRHIISNSTFSWWGGYLSGSTEVIRPDCLFEGKLKQRNDDKDFYPEAWLVFDPKNADTTYKRIPLTDVTFVIPAYYDHPDRKQNIELCITMLQKHFDTNVIIGEFKTNEFNYEGCDYIQFPDMAVFHRTKMLNELFKRAKTEIIFNWDADVMIAPIQIIQAVEKLRSGIEMVFPYNGQFSRIPRNVWYERLMCYEDIGIVGDTKFSGMEYTAAVSVGGAVGILKTPYLAIGGENENFISFGAEDVERVIRAKTMGLQVERVDGPMYHLNHWVGVNSSTANPYFYANRDELERVKAMNKEELSNYIKTMNNELH